MPKKSPGEKSTKSRLPAESQPQPTHEAGQLISRPPIVCFLGHVDHGKTSILDFIRQTHVQKSEAGGITQSIGACHVEGITFIDTPGHAAFTAMRARGGQTADIAVLVVAADDGIMPQTIEAIAHIKAAGVPMLVAINKMDIPSVTSDKVKQQLVEQGILLEGWGGDVVNVECSAITGKGVDNLLEMLKLMAEIEEFKSDPKARPEGILLESFLDNRRGPIATVIVKQGTLEKGQNLVAEDTSGRIKGLWDWQGKILNKVGPGFPAEILGLKNIVRGGVKFTVTGTGKEALALCKPTLIKAPAKPKAKHVKSDIDQNKDEEGNDTSEEEEKVRLIKLVIKTDTDGSLDALRYSIIHLENEKVQVLFVHESVGNITEADVLLAQSSGASIVGLKVKADAVARQLIKQEGVPTKTYEIIYHLLEDLAKIIKGKEKEGELVRTGLATVLKVFVLSNKSMVAGSKVKEGAFKLNQQVRIWRDKKQVGESRIVSLKILKKEIRKVSEGEECGIIISPAFEFKQGDIIEAMEESKVDYSL
ncbi:translation initiation factor IF-2 [Patescibacteria group bacterium]|nr:translation initiation factor IF-2 [Patescibacteria group bacterium]